MLIDNYKEFNVGMKVIILSSRHWNCTLNMNCPTNKNIYPYHCTIKEIDKDDFDFFAMTCGYFGWALDYLIEFNLIIPDLKEIRKQKLQKINHANR